MNLAMEFLSDGVRCIAVRKKFQFGLRGNVAGQWTNACQITIRNGVRDEDRIYAVEIDAGNVGRNIRFVLAWLSRQLGCSPRDCR